MAHKQLLKLIFNSVLTALIDVAYKEIRRRLSRRAK